MASLVWIYGDPSNAVIVHPVGEMNCLDVRQRRIRSPRNRLAMTEHTYIVHGELYPDVGAADTTANLDDKIEALENAYADDGEDFGLYIDNGDGTYTATQHVLDSDSSINGVRIDVVSYPRFDPEEMVTVRSVRIIAQALYLNIESQIWSFQESIRMIGNGGARQQYVSLLSPLPPAPFLQVIPQQEVIYLNTPMTFIQSGVAIGLQGYPSPGAVIQHPAIIEDFSRHEEWPDSPQSYINNLLLYPYRWRYVLQSNIALTAFPSPDHPAG